MLYHGLTYSGKRKYPIPALFNNHVPSKGRGEETEALVKVIVQGTGSQKNRLQHRTEVYPHTHTTYHHNINGHLPRFLLPRTSYAPFYKNYKSCKKKKKKAQFEKSEWAWEWQQWYRDKREELGLLCYYEIFALSMKQYNVTKKWTLITCNCILQALGKSLEEV